MLEYRKAGGGDVESLVDFRIEFIRLVKELRPEDEAAWRAELRERFGRELASGRFVAWLCLDAGLVVAVSGLSLPEGGSLAGNGAGRRDAALVHNMFTQAGYRRRGIASELLARCLGEGRVRGVRSFVLQPTDAGKGIYARAGFRASGREMLLTDDGFA